jgi:hypothetical protein
MFALFTLNFKMSSLMSLGSSMIGDAIFGWPAQPAVIKIDTHHHYVPSFYAKG